MLIKKILITATCSVVTSMAYANSQFSGHIEGELRYYPESALYATQADTFESFAIAPEYYWSNESKEHSLQIKPFYRYSSGDDGNRTHGDIREFYYRYVDNGLQWDIGINTVFWGVTESAHLVDIINPRRTQYRVWERRKKFLPNISGPEDHHVRHKKPTVS